MWDQFAVFYSITKTENGYMLQAIDGTKQEAETVVEVEMILRTWFDRAMSEFKTSEHERSGK